jgi:hypothetical protein
MSPLFRIGRPKEGLSIAEDEKGVVDDEKFLKCLQYRRSLPEREHRLGAISEDARRTSKRIPVLDVRCWEIGPISGAGVYKELNWDKARR